MKRCIVKPQKSASRQSIKSNNRIRYNRRIVASYEISEEELNNLIDNLESTGNDIAYEVAGGGSVSFAFESENRYGETVLKFNVKGPTSKRLDSININVADIEALGIDGIDELYDYFEEEVRDRFN